MIQLKYSRDRDNLHSSQLDQESCMRVSVHEDDIDSDEDLQNPDSLNRTLSKLLESNEEDENLSAQIRLHCTFESSCEDSGINTSSSEMFATNSSSIENSSVSPISPNENSPFTDFRTKEDKSESEIHSIPINCQVKNCSGSSECHRNTVTSIDNTIDSTFQRVVIPSDRQDNSIDSLYDTEVIETDFDPRANDINDGANDIVDVDIFKESTV